MSTHRNASELRQAAIDAGWQGEPLAEEILSKLDDLERGRPPQSPLMRWVAIGACVIAALFAIFYFLLAGSMKSGLAQKDAVIEQLNKSRIAQQESDANAMQALVKSAQETAKGHAAATDANQATIALLKTRVAELTEDVRRLTEEKKAAELKPQGKVP